MAHVKMKSAPVKIPDSPTRSTVMLQKEASFKAPLPATSARLHSKPKAAFLLSAKSATSDDVNTPLTTKGLKFKSYLTPKQHSVESGTTGRGGHFGGAFKFAISSSKTFVKTPSARTGPPLSSSTTKNVSTFPKIIFTKKLQSGGIGTETRREIATNGPRHNFQVDMKAKAKTMGSPSVASTQLAPALKEQYFMTPKALQVHSAKDKPFGTLALSKSSTLGGKVRISTKKLGSISDNSPANSVMPNIAPLSLSNSKGTSLSVGATIKKRASTAQPGSELSSLAKKSKGVPQSGDHETLPLIANPARAKAEPHGSLPNVIPFVPDNEQIRSISIRTAVNNCEKPDALMSNREMAPRSTENFRFTMPSTTNEVDDTNLEAYFFAPCDLNDLNDDQFMKRIKRIQDFIQDACVQQQELKTRILDVHADISECLIDAMNDIIAEEGKVGLQELDLDPASESELLEPFSDSQFENL